MPDSRKIHSEPKPLNGQHHRSSENFGTNDLPDWGSLRWTCPNGVSFKVKKDVNGHDPTEFENVKNGTVTNYKSHRNLYISDPKGINEAFDITVSSSKK